MLRQLPPFATPLAHRSLSSALLSRAAAPLPPPPPSLPPCTPSASTGTAAAASVGGGGAADVGAPPPLPAERACELAWLGAVTVWTQPEDRALMAAARAAPGGQPGLETFAAAVAMPPGSPLAGRCAALAAARYAKLVRLATAAAAAKQQR